MNSKHIQFWLKFEGLGTHRPKVLISHSLPACGKSDNYLALAQWRDVDLLMAELSVSKIIPIDGIRENMSPQRQKQINHKPKNSDYRRHLHNVETTS